MSEHEETTIKSWDVSISFHGLTGRQRKIQKQHLMVKDLDKKPSEDELREIVVSKLEDERARNIHNNRIRGTVYECLVSYERGYQKKQFEVFSDKNTCFELEHVA